MTHDSSDIGTIAHLPECPMSALPRPTFDYVTTTWPDGEVKEVKWECVCPLLRACEQRVRMEDDDYAYVAAQAEADGRRRGWVEALDAAREALLSAWFTANRDEMTWPDALAAIDALWEKP